MAVPVATIQRQTTQCTFHSLFTCEGELIGKHSRSKKIPRSPVLAENSYYEVGDLMTHLF
ncbi:hypothetical protein YQE_06363, partial [Dendroctonus ponderosae]